MLSIIIPIYNERATLAELVTRVLATPFEKQIILVNDKSTDGSAEIADNLAHKHPSILVIHQPRNAGKGAALRAGFAAATGDIVLIQDADLEYDPAEYPNLVEPILNGKADVVFGSRFIGGEPHRVLYFWHSVGNRLITLFSNALTNLNLTDIECCYKVFKRSIIQSFTIEEDSFGIEPELTAKVAKHRDAAGEPLRVFEVGVSYSGRTYAQGKKITWPDGLRALWCIFKYNLTR